MNDRQTRGQAPAEPWYRNAWVWLVIAIPGMTIAGCLFTIYLAVANPDQRVSDPPEPATREANP